MIIFMDIRILFSPHVSKVIRHYCKWKILCFQTYILLHKHWFALVLRPLWDGGPHDVYHHIPAGCRYGPRRLEAQDLGLQLVLCVRHFTCTEKKCVIQAG